jgi:hypothetical protein
MEVLITVDGRPPVKDWRFALVPQNITDVKCTASQDAC